MKRFYVSIVLSSFLFGSIFAQKGDIKIFEKKKDELGLINSKSNKVVLSPKYQSIEPLTDGLYSVKNKLGLVGVVTRDGRFIVPEIYEEVKIFGGNCFEVKKDGKCGLVDFSNKEILPLKYLPFKPISDDLFEFSDGTKKGYITKYGYVLIPAEYDSLDRLNTSSYLVSKDGKYGIIDNEGKVVVPLKYDRIENSSEERYITVKSQNKEGLIDYYTLKIILEPVYDSVTSDPVGFLLKAGDKIGFLTKSGKLILPSPYRVVFEQPELGLVVIKEGDKFGFITSDGFASSPIYDNISRFSNRGIAFVEKQGKLQAVNLEGKEMTLQDLTKGYQTPP